ncbi:MAG: DNA primase [Candidatus Paceibacterota bacterium]|jgi:DNA primase
MSSSVEQIKEKLGIEEVVGSYIKLERAGNNLKARCPFHNEKTPSFFVSPDRGSYYCFGCGAKGDIFSFVEQFESVDFVGALKILADKAGIQLEKFTQKGDKKDRIYLLLETVALFLQNNLASEDIPLEYLKKRGLKDKTIKDWRIGYVRDDWRTMHDHLRSKGFTEDEMLRAGITKTEGQNTYDRFRGRIMFPIFDSAGRVVAFSGRILHDDGKSAKYLNSPQTEVFDKSKILYGYDRAKQSIRKFDFSILVEGQMDILMCHQAGFTNTVASSGTALTALHLSLLKRISNKIIMSFDSDNAGAKAAERGWALALSAGMEVKIAAIPEGYDPADLILKDKEAFKDVLKKSVHLIDFLLGRALKETEDKKKLWSIIKTKILPYMYLLESSAEKGRYVSKISEMIGIKEEFIWDDLKKVKLSEEFKPEASNEESFADKEVLRARLKPGSALRSLAAMALWLEGMEKPIIGTAALREKILNTIGKEEYDALKREMEPMKSELAFEAEVYYGKSGEKKLDKEMEYLILNVTEEQFKKELSTLLLELKKAEGAKESEKAIAILTRCNEITKKLHNIKNEKNKFLKSNL